MRWIHAYLAIAVLVGFPAVGFTQASIAGVVKDTSGSVLPGVTVEASSSALLERTVFSTVTDGSGRYTLSGLRPDNYTVKFTAFGFTTVRREGIELRDTAEAAVNADMRAGPADGWAFTVPPEFRFLYNGYPNDGNVQPSGPQAMWANLPCERITLERSCLFACRQYKVTLRRGGGGTRTNTSDDWVAGAELHAVVPRGSSTDPRSRPFPEQQGEFEGTLRLETYGRLCYLLTTANFLELRNRYESSESDGGTVTVTLTVGGRTKSVSDYDYSGPIALWGIEQAIESIAQSLQWRRK